MSEIFKSAILASCTIGGQLEDSFGVRRISPAGGNRLPAVPISGIQAEEDTYDEKLKNANSISQPMASKKLTKKIHKLIEKAAKQKSYLRNGLKDVQVRLRKGETGLVIFAGDVTPVEILCHLPAVCEERNIPYCYTPSRKDLGAAMGVKRGTVAMMVREHPDYQDLFDKLKVELSALPIPS